MKTNIVLIGLMGAGKTTIGKILSAQLDMPFTDCDENIEKSYGNISDLFNKGENYFRDGKQKILRMLPLMCYMSAGEGLCLDREYGCAERKGCIFI